MAKNTAGKRKPRKPTGSRAKKTDAPPKAGAAPKTGGAAQEKPRRVSGGPINRLSLVRKMIRRYTGDLDSKEGPKSGVAELIRLIALEKELAGETENVREIKVTWVEPKATEPLSAE